MGIKMALKRGWKSVGRRQKRRCRLRLAPPFLGLLEDAEKGRFCRDFGFGNSKSGNEGVDGEGVKVRIFSV